MIGISISVLFQRLDKQSSLAPDGQPLDSSAKNQLWEALVARELVHLGDAKSALALKKLSLEDILDLGLGERKIKLRVDAETEQEATRNTPTLETEIIQQSVGVAVPDGTSPAPANQPSEAPEPPPRRKRGRPPGKSLKKFAAQNPAPELPPRHAPRVIFDASQPTPPSRTTPSRLSPPSDSSPATRTSRLSTGAYIRKAIFTPHEEVQRQEDDAKIEAGIPGVYINPTVAQRTAELEGRKTKKQMVAVFKSVKLKLPQWLAARKGTWKDAFANKTGHDISTGMNEEGMNEEETPSTVNLPGQRKRKPHHDVPSDLVSMPDQDALPRVAAGAQQSSRLNAPLQINGQSVPSTGVGSEMDQQPAYNSPYGISSTSTATASNSHTLSYNAPAQSSTGHNPVRNPLTQNQEMPAIAPSYNSPYHVGDMPSTQNHEQSEHLHYPVPPPGSTSRDSFRDPSSTFDAQSIHEGGDQPEVPSTLGAKPYTGGRGKRKRESSVTGADAAAKRHQAISVSSGQRSSLPETEHSAMQPPIPTATSPESLAELVKKQEEEKEREIQRENELQDALSAAEEIDAPDSLARIAAAYQGSVGNLILSKDQSIVYFYGADQHPPQNPILNLEVSAIIDNPIMSMVGSKPMELRVKSKDANNVDITHRFNIGLTKPAHRAAEILRSKLVLAKINAQVTAGVPYEPHNQLDVPQIEVVKPFLCEKCGKRFKNKEGILYHRTRSKSTCNPSFDPSSVRPPKPTRVKKKAVVAESPQERDSPRRKRDGPVENGERGNGGHDLSKDVPDNDQSDTSSTDSLGSVLEWAEQASRPQSWNKSSRRRSSTLPARKGISNLSDGSGQTPAPSYPGEEESDEEEPRLIVDDEEESESDDLYEDRDETLIERRKRTMRKRSATVKAAGGDMLAYPAEYAPDKKQTLPSSSPKRVRIPLSEQEKERRAIKAALKMQCWATAPSLLPNPETGAWDQTPTRVRRSPRKPVRRAELPEPITFMQAEDGAWSLRPFGHGVKPIYARPARRADGNPHLPRYLERIESGFRPVLIPTKNRIFLPAVPTKSLLKDPAAHGAQAPVEADLTAESPKVTGKRKRSERSRDSESGSEYSEGSDQEQESNIPKATRRKRPYNRRPVDEVNSSKLNGNSRRQTRQSKRLDEIHLLNSFEPKKIVPGKGGQRNVGLESLPASFGLGSRQSRDLQSIQDEPSFVDTESNKRLRDKLPPSFSLHDILANVPSPPETQSSQDRIYMEIDAVSKWEQDAASQLLRSGTLLPDYRWVNHTITSLDGAVDLKHVKISWNADTAFDMETIPYAELDDSDDIVFTDVSSKPQYKMPRSSLTPASQNARDLRELQKEWTTRRLTALSTDLAGLGDDTEQVAKELGTQFTTPESIHRTRNRDSNMSTKEETRLIVAVCVLRTVTGGLDQNIDWVLVATLFGNYSMNFLTKRWASLLQKKRAMIEKLIGDFQDAFLVAYQKGEIPPINYDKLVEYDWGWLVDWAMKKVDMTVEIKAVDLPDTRDRLDRLYHLKEQEIEAGNRQEGYYSLHNPVYKRMELASSVANAIPAITPPKAKCADDIKIDKITLVKSWARAAALTPDEAWDHRVAKAKFRSLGNPLLEDKHGNDPNVAILVNEAVEILKNDKVLMQKNKGRATPDRSYEPTDVFFSSLRKHVTAQQFLDAVAFKRFLDQEFSSGKTCIRSDYMANEGTLMCVTNLQAHGRIRLKGVGVPMNKFGFMDGGYETRKIPKEKFRFDMDIYPTSNYVYDSDNEVLQRLGNIEPPRGSKLGELPIWYGIGDELIEELWKKVLVAFSGIIALRAGSSIESLKKTFHPTLEEWEIWRLLEWGVEVGLFERLHEVIGGWTTGEWWWLIVGRYCSGEL